MNMRTSVDIDLIVYSFVQKLQDRGRLGTFVSVEINFDDPVTITLDAENRGEVQSIDTAELLEWVNRYKDHVIKHDMPLKNTFYGRYEL
jgi:hypothetical protein